MTEVNSLKKQLRQELLAKRRSLSTDFIEQSSCKMQKHLYNWCYYLQAKTVMAYLSMPDEPQTKGIILHAWSCNKMICVPHMRSTWGIMDAAAISSFDDLVSGRFKLLVPNPNNLRLVQPQSIDLILVPGIAFDCFGNRVGMGAGYYDRFLLKAAKVTRVGICFASHVLTPELPHEQHDLPMHYLLTEKGILNCSKGKM